MALQMSYTNDQGINSPNSYWKVSNFMVNVDKKNAFFSFRGWFTKTTKESDKTPIGEHNYNISSPLFDTYYTKAISKELNLAEIFYDYAKNNKDIVLSYTQKEVTKEIQEIVYEPSDIPGEMIERIVTSTVTEMVNDQPIMGSFFNGALDV